jgi:hypothetical protein
MGVEFLETIQDATTPALAHTLDVLGRGYGPSRMEQHDRQPNWRLDSRPPSFSLIGDS